VSRNYTDSQLGLGGRGGGAAAAAAARAGQPQQYPPVRSPSHQQQQHQQQQQYGTPRVPSHELALKDRGSAENSDASEGGYIVSKGSSGSSSSHHRHEDRNVKQFKARGIQSPDGRRTPVRDANVQGQKIFFSPHRQRDHQRDHASTPTSVYSEPPRDRSNPNSPHNMQQRGGRGSQNHLGYHRCRNEPPPPNSNRYGPQQPQQSKLPHGLTVQELKEMTRARLAADAEAAENSSVHSGGTHGSSNGSIYANVIPSHSSDPLTRNLVQTNDSIRHTQSYGQKPVQHQYQQHPQQQRQFQQYPNNARHPSPVFDAAAPNQFNSAMQSPRRISPLSDYQSDAGMLTAANSGSGVTNAPFSPPPMSWAGGEASSMMNRSRCHSAEANLSPLRSVGGTANVPMSMEGNRRRCLTTSPLAQMTRMDRVSEDKPFWFDDTDMDRLAIPQLSIRSSLDSSAPPTFSDSAFQPIGKPRGLPFSEQKPQQLSHADRMVSMESQGHGDLPSSMAEAVLNSLTGAPPGASAIGGDVIGSPFRPVRNQSHTVGNLRFRTMSDNLLSASASGSELGTLSWGGDADDDASNNLSLSHDFNSLLNIGEPPSLSPLRGRANTDPPHVYRWK